MSADELDTARYFAEVDKELDRRVRRDPRNVWRFVKAAAGWAFCSMSDPRAVAAVVTACYWLLLAVGCLGGLSFGRLLLLTVGWMLCVIVLVPLAVLKSERQD